MSTSWTPHLVNPWSGSNVTFTRGMYVYMRLCEPPSRVMDKLFVISLLTTIRELLRDDGKRVPLVLWLVVWTRASLVSHLIVAFEACKSCLTGTSSLRTT